MYVAAITAFLGVAAGAPLPTTWPPPHNTSTQCVRMLAKHKLDWLLEPFTCTKAQKTSNAHIVLGTGLGGTGTRSVATAVDKLGYPACHSFLYVLRLLQMPRVACSIIMRSISRRPERVPLFWISFSR